MAYASAADLEAILGRTLAELEVTRAVTMLEISSRAIDAHTNGRTVDPDVLRTVCQLSTRRLFERPDGVSQETLGDWSTSYAPAGILNDDERAMLDQAGTAGTRRVTYGSPRTSSGTWHITDTGTIE